jgi:hypothetical protein
VVLRSAGSVRSTLRSTMAAKDPNTGATTASPAVAHPPAISPADASMSSESSERMVGGFYFTSLSFVARPAIGAGLGTGGASISAHLK